MNRFQIAPALEPQRSVAVWGSAAIPSACPAPRADVAHRHQQRRGLLGPSSGPPISFPPSRTCASAAPRRSAPSRPD